MCGQKFVISGNRSPRYVCGSHVNGGPAACLNKARVSRDLAEDRLLAPIVEGLLSPAAVSLAEQEIRRLHRDQQTASRDAMPGRSPNWTPSSHSSKGCRLREFYQRMWQAQQSRKRKSTAERSLLQPDVIEGRTSVEQAELSDNFIQTVRGMATQFHNRSSCEPLPSATSYLKGNEATNSLVRDPVGFGVVRSAADCSIVPRAVGPSNRMASMSSPNPAAPSPTSVRSIAFVPRRSCTAPSISVG